MDGASPHTQHRKTMLKPDDVDAAEAMKLSTWEPDLLAQALAGLVQTRKAAAKANIPVNNRDEVLERLTLIDPKRALDLE